MIRDSNRPPEADTPAAAERQLEEALKKGGKVVSVGEGMPPSRPLPQRKPLVPDAGWPKGMKLGDQAYLDSLSPEDREFFLQNPAAVMFLMKDIVPEEALPPELGGPKETAPSDDDSDE